MAVLLRERVQRFLRMICGGFSHSRKLTVTSESWAIPTPFFSPVKTRLESFV